MLEILATAAETITDMMVEVVLVPTTMMFLVSPPIIFLVHPAMMLVAVLTMLHPRRKIIRTIVSAIPTTSFVTKTNVDSSSKIIRTRVGASMIVVTTSPTILATNTQHIASMLHPSTTSVF
jgi:hypothetical protein